MEKNHHLEDTMIMYGAYNSETLTDLIDTVHRMHSKSIWQEKMFMGKVYEWVGLYMHQEHNYTISAVLFLTTIREKYVKMYERFIEELKTYSKVIRILSKGYLLISLLLPSELQKILNEVKQLLLKQIKVMTLSC